MSKLKKLFAPVDMTVGIPWKQILLFTGPMLIGNIAQQLYNTVDSIVVGNCVGDNALAAVGSAAPIFNLLLVLFIGISTGASIMVAQFFGARDREALSYTIGNCITLTLIASIGVMIIGPLVARPLLHLLNTPESIIDWCTSYLVILFVGIAGMAFYNILSGVLRGLGDAVSALIYLLVASAINVVLDLVFVIAFDMGVAGVALATVIAQAVSAVLCIRRLMQMKDLFDLKLSCLRVNKKFTMGIIKLGVPTGITQAILSMSMILVQSLTNSFGEIMIAANVVVMRVDGFAMMPIFSFGSAMTTFAGQNVGARQYDRVMKGAKQGTLLSVSVAAVITVILLLLGKPLMGIFTDTPELINLGMLLLRILAVGYLAMALSQCLAGVMRGAGDTVTPMWISIIQTICLRMPLAYIMCYLTRSADYPNGRQECLFISLLIAWLIGALLTAIMYKRGKWKRKFEDVQ